MQVTIDIPDKYVPFLQKTNNVDFVKQFILDQAIQEIYRLITEAYNRITVDKTIDEKLVEVSR